MLRHWSAGQDTPAHINSDVCISDRELIYCNGGSGTIVMIDLETLRVVPDHRRAAGRCDAAARRPRRPRAPSIDALTRGSLAHEQPPLHRALRVARGTLVDSVYACQISADQSLLFTANRGLNTITVYDYPENTVRLRVTMPELQEFDTGLPLGDPPRLPPQHSAQPTPAAPIERT